MHRLRHAGCCFLSSSGAARFKVFIQPSHQRDGCPHLEENLGIPRDNRQTRSPQHDKSRAGSASFPGLPVGFGDQCPSGTRHTSRDIFCSGRFCISCCKIPTVPKRSQLLYSSKTASRETQGASGSQIEGQRWLPCHRSPSGRGCQTLAFRGIAADTVNRKRFRRHRRLQSSARKVGTKRPHRSSLHSTGEIPSVVLTPWLISGDYLV